VQQSAAESGAELPLSTRLSCDDALEWILRAHLAMQHGGGDDARLIALREHAPTVSAGESTSGTKTEAATEIQALTPDDTDWVQRARRWISAPVDHVLATMPAAISVSAIKEQAMRGVSDEEAPARPLDVPAAPLGEPEFTQADTAVGGAAAGTAVHHFLQMADLAQIGTTADVEAQIAGMVSDGRLAAADAEAIRVDDVVWLSQTEEGRILTAAGSALRRETPFTFALPVDDHGEHAIVRGIIDCHVDTPDGLVIVDYKTDRFRDNEDRRRRIEGYSRQLQIYGWALGDILDRPVARLALLFLRERQVERVPIGRPSIASLLTADAAT
jgi:ATP-dependent exoDNAse (exonuclease V) beta subunit